MSDNRYILAKQHGMSKEFVDWFFDEKKDSCGIHWLIMFAAMWEGWKASREQLMIQLPMRQAVYASGYGEGYMVDNDAGDALKYDDVIEILTAAGISVKSD